MNDENFDNVFGEKLKYGKNFAFTDANWEVMEKNLQNYYAQRDEKRRYLWLLLPLLLLLGFAAGSVYALQGLQNKINNLNAQVVKIQSSKLEENAKSIKNENTSFIQHDTIYKRVVVKQYDTIYRTIIIQSAKLNDFSSQVETINTSENNVTTTKNNFPASENSNFSNDEFDPKNTKSPLKNNLIFTKKNKKDSSTENKLVRNFTNNSSDVIITKNENRLNQPKKDTPNDTMKQRLLLKQDSITVLLPTKLDTNSRTVAKEMADSITDKKVLSPKKEVQPIKIELIKIEPVKIEPVKIKKFEIGISGGWAAYSGDSVVRQTGYSVGVRGNYFISKRFKLVADVQIAESDYQKNTIYYTKDVPYILPPTRYDVFSTVYCDQTFLNYGIGLQYALTDNKRINPYLGFGFIGQSKINEQFDYRFINGYQKETAVVTTRKDAAIKFPFLRLNIGAQFQLLKKISAQLEGSYDVKLNSDVYSKSFLQLRGVVLYQL